jgi:hypothetical protein
MAKDSDFFTVTGDISPKGYLGLGLGAIGGFSGEHSPLKTFGELIESMREHGMDRAVWRSRATVDPRSSITCAATTNVPVR